MQEQLKLLFEEPETSKHLRIREKRSNWDVSASELYGDLPLRNDNVTHIQYKWSTGIQFIERQSVATARNGVRTTVCDSSQEYTAGKFVV